MAQDAGETELDQDQNSAARDNLRGPAAQAGMLAWAARLAGAVAEADGSAWG